MIDELGSWESDVRSGVDEAGVIAPTYCPRCDRDVPSTTATLCERCGETLRAQAYCTVCEKFLRKPPGDLCPKHEIPLLDAADLAAAHPVDSSIVWTTVKVYDNDLAAEGPRLRLEAEGIPAFIEGARMGSKSMYHVATGGVRLQVPANLLADARVLLAQYWGPVADDDELDEAFEDLAPGPGDVRRASMKWLLLLVLFGPAVLCLIGYWIGLDVRRLGVRPIRLW